MEDQIVNCPKCSGKNRVPASALDPATKAKCGHCGAPLSPASIDEAAGIKAAVIEKPGHRRERVGKWVSGIALSVLATGAYWLYAANGEQGTPEPDTTTLGAPELLASEPSPAPDVLVPSVPDFSDPPPSDVPADPVTDILGVTPAPPALTPETFLIPQYASPGLLYNWTGTEPLAPLSIVTSAGQDYYVKLVYTGTNTEAVTYYVQGGSTADFMAPLGSYELRYASGTTWYGPTDLFGPDTSYAKASGSLDFVDSGDQYTGYTIELILQEGGNLDTYGITPDQF